MTTENKVRSEERLSSRSELFTVNILYSPRRFAPVRAACVCTSWYFYVYRSLTVYYSHVTTNCGPGSSVGIATDYGLDGPGIKSR